eukprot:tig00000147_g9457.t1
MCADGMPQLCWLGAEVKDGKGSDEGVHSDNPMQPSAGWGPPPSRRGPPPETWGQWTRRSWADFDPLNNVMIKHSRRRFWLGWSAAITLAFALTEIGIFGDLFKELAWFGLPSFFAIVYIISPAVAAFALHVLLEVFFFNGSEYRRVMSMTIGWVVVPLAWVLLGVGSKLSNQREWYADTLSSIGAPADTVLQLRNSPNVDRLVVFAILEAIFATITFGIVCRYKTIPRPAGPRPGDGYAMPPGNTEGAYPPQLGPQQPLLAAPETSRTPVPPGVPAGAAPGGPDEFQRFLAMYRMMKAMEGGPAPAAAFPAASPAAAAGAGGAGEQLAQLLGAENPLALRHLKEAMRILDASGPAASRSASAAHPQPQPQLIASPPPVHYDGAASLRSRPGSPTLPYPSSSSAYPSDRPLSPRRTPGGALYSPQGGRPSSPPLSNAFHVQYRVGAALVDSQPPPELFQELYAGKIPAAGPPPALGSHQQHDPSGSGQFFRGAPALQEEPYRAPLRAEGVVIRATPERRGRFVPPAGRPFRALPEQAAAGPAPAPPASVPSTRVGSPRKFRVSPAKSLDLPRPSPSPAPAPPPPRPGAPLRRRLRRFPGPRLPRPAGRPSPPRRGRARAPRPPRSSGRLGGPEAGEGVPAATVDNLRAAIRDLLDGTSGALRRARRRRSGGGLDTSAGSGSRPRPAARPPSRPRRAPPARRRRCRGVWGAGGGHRTGRRYLLSSDEESEGEGAGEARPRFSWAAGARQREPSSSGRARAEAAGAPRRRGGDGAGLAADARRRRGRRLVLLGAAGPPSDAAADAEVAAASLAAAEARGQIDVIRSAVSASSLGSGRPRPAQAQAAAAAPAAPGGLDMAEVERRIARYDADTRLRDAYARHPPRAAGAPAPRPAPAAAPRPAAPPPPPPPPLPAPPPPSLRRPPAPPADPRLALGAQQAAAAMLSPAPSAPSAAATPRGAATPSPAPAPASARAIHISPRWRARSRSPARIPELSFSRPTPPREEDGPAPPWYEIERDGSSPPRLLDRSNPFSEGQD